MQFLVEDSTNANERAILIEGWTKDDPPVPLDISAVTLRVSINGGTPADADGTTTRIDSSHVHRFVFDNDVQFQAFAAGDVGVLIVPDSASGSGRLGLSFPFLVSAGNPGAASLTASDVSADIAGDAAVHTAIAEAVVEAEWSAVKTLKRTGTNGNTGLEITLPTTGAATTTLAVSADASPITEVDTAS